MIVPFSGSSSEAVLLLDSLWALQLGGEDELIVVDNSPAATVTAPTGERLRVLRAAAMQSSYYARNIGAEAARGEWILFLDADTRPSPQILDLYFDRVPAADEGLVAGEVISAPEQTALAARHMRARDHLRVEPLFAMKPLPTGVTANLLVRKAVWEEVGGFHEVRSGADFEFCWRAQEADWRLGYRPEARVEHLHSESVGGMLRKARRYGPGQSWLNRRYPGSAPPPRLLRALARAVGGGIVWTLTGQRERARLKLLDGLWMGAFSVGYYAGDNRPFGNQVTTPRGGSRRRDQPSTIVVGRTFGDRSDPATGERIAALRKEEGGDIRVVAARRGACLDSAVLAEVDLCPELEARFLEDEPGSKRLGALLRLLVWHPGRLVLGLRSARSMNETMGLERWALVGALAAAVIDLRLQEPKIETVDWRVGGVVASALLGASARETEGWES